MDPRKELGAPCFRRQSEEFRDTEALWWAEEKEKVREKTFLVVVCIKLGPRTCYVGILLLNYNPNPGMAFKRILGVRKCRASRNGFK